VNEGINWTSPNNVYWKHDVERSESVKIILHGNAEFEAKDVVLKVQLLINSIFLICCSLSYFPPCFIRVTMYLKYPMVIECASFRTEQVC
jgi:hypothetical protein